MPNYYSQPSGYASLNPIDSLLDNTYNYDVIVEEYDSNSYENFDDDDNPDIFTEEGFRSSGGRGRGGGRRGSGFSRGFRGYPRRTSSYVGGRRYPYWGPWDAYYYDDFYGPNMYDLYQDSLPVIPQEYPLPMPNNQAQSVSTSLAPPEEQPKKKSEKKYNDLVIAGLLTVVIGGLIWMNQKKKNE